MKKNFKLVLLILIIIFISLFMCFVLYNKKNNDKQYEQIDLSDVFLDINHFYFNEFNSLDLKYDSVMFIPIDLTNVSEYLIGVSSIDEKEYFIILNGLSENNIELLKENVKMEQEHGNKYFKDTKVITKNNYTYMVVTREKNSIINQIINSYID